MSTRRDQQSVESALPLLPCPLCQFHPRPSISCGGRSGKFFLSSVAGCSHAWIPVNYRMPAATADEARQRWNLWAKANVPITATETAP